ELLLLFAPLSLACLPSFLLPQLPVEIQNRAVGVKAGNLPELHQQLVDLLYARYGSLGQLLGYQTDPIPFPEGVIGFNLKNTENVTLNMADFDLTATTLPKIIVRMADFKRFA
ncbi:hypothetical protein, partial [Enterococcus faecalis]|uniref:hypothetical protein n=1 Tax=Enterococcus faecalis TaxID=1351 RepID=UPI001F49FBB8